MIECHRVIKMKIINDILFELCESEYKKFNEKLIPGINRESVLGVRIPALRKLAKEIYKEKWIGEFLNDLPHKYLEENHLHAFLIEQEKDFQKALHLTEEFLPYIDNWATCDSFFPKIFKKHIREIDEKIDKWLQSGEEYTIRFALGLIMRLHLDENFNPDYLKKASEIKSDKYYVNMMIAWLFATALAKREEVALDFILNKKLPTWIHNKTIRKALESYRVDPKTKLLLKKHKIPNNA